MSHVSEHDPRIPQPEWLPVANSITAFAADVTAVRPDGAIRIFCGEANPAVYNDPCILDALRDMHYGRSAHIRVITGPILVVDGNGENGLLMLHREGVLEQLLHRPARYAANHFRVVETELVYRYYMEFPHVPLLPVERRRCANLNRLEGGDVHHLAVQAIHLFDGWMEELVRDAAPSAGTLPWVTTKDGLHRLLAEAEGQGISFRYATIHDIRGLPSASEVLHPYAFPL